MQLDKRNASAKEQVSKADAPTVHTQKTGQRNLHSPGEVSSALAPEKLQPRRPGVSISGEALLRQRLFHVTDPNRAIPILGKAHCGKSYLDTSFLTQGDRTRLSDVYKWAFDEGADLGYVDELGRKLAEYREKDNGRISAPHNRGDIYDGEGYKVYYSFTDKDAATAKRILDSDALRTTRLDQGFIRFITDKDYGAMYHNDFDFMEQVINRFSEKGIESPALTPKFAKREYTEGNFVKTRSKETYGADEPHIRDHLNALSSTKNTAKPKEITLESLRVDMRNALFQAMGVKSFSSLFALLFKDKR